MTATKTYTVTEEPDAKGSDVTLVLTDDKGFVAHRARGTSLVDHATSRALAIQGLKDFGFTIDGEMTNGNV